MADGICFLARTWEELDRDTLYELLRLRQEVFVVEQRCFYQDLDGLDPLAVHLLMSDEQGLCGGLRVFPPDERGSARIGRVLTALRVRARGLGRPLMRAGEAEVVARFGPVPIRLSAQAHLERFYASLGYAVDGPGFDEDGIPHLPMSRPV
jgi:ElaA protein